MMNQLIQLLKNIFSREPFEQKISIEFTIYDIIFIILMLWGLWILLK